jgi:hypothetical protein
MALSTTDPVLAHSLWLHLRSSRRRKFRRPRWRSGTLGTPPAIKHSRLWLHDLVPSANFENVEQPAQNEAMQQEAPVLGGLAGP